MQKVADDREEALRISVPLGESISSTDADKLFERLSSFQQALVAIEPKIEHFISLEKRRTNFQVAFCHRNQRIPFVIYTFCDRECVGISVEHGRCESLDPEESIFRVVNCLRGLVYDDAELRSNEALNDCLSHVEIKRSRSSPAASTHPLSLVGSIRH